MTPRIVVLYTGIISVNPTYTSLPLAMSRLAGRSVAVVDVGLADIHEIRSLVEQTEIVVFDSTIFSTRFMAPPQKGSVAVRRWRGRNFYEAIIDIFLGSPAYKILMGALDLHWSGPENWLLHNYRAVDALVWMYGFQIPALEAVPQAWRDAWMAQHLKPSEIKEIIESSGLNLIEAPHCVGTGEFGEPLPSLWDACIPGVNYRTREIACASAKDARLSLAPYRQLDRAISIPWRLLPRKLAAPSVLGKYNYTRYQNARQLCRASTLVYVDGSGYGYAVRKFMEIPAWGAPMICMPHSKMNDYGFVPDRHFIPCLPESFGDTALTLLTSKEKRLGLIGNATEAQQLVHQLHTCKARASQLLWAFEQLLEDRCSAFRWSKGQFVSCKHSLDHGINDVWSPREFGEPT